MVIGMTLEMMLGHNADSHHMQMLLLSLMQFGASAASQLCLAVQSVMEKGTASTQVLNNMMWIWTSGSTWEN